MPNHAQIRGCHHCIGTSRILIDAIFSVIHSRAIANGGVISAKAVMDAKAQLIETLPSSVDLFETINRECMAASKSTAPDPFSHDMILSTLLAASAEGSAKHVFKLQIEHCGANWLNYFFQAFAKCAQKNLSQASWKHLIATFVQVAETKKANMQVSDLLHQNQVKETLLECIAPFYKTLGLDEIVKSTAAEIDSYLSRQYNITGPFIAKITDHQMKHFLEMLREEMPLKVRPSVTDNNMSVAS